jgi:hypothetical protein
MRASQVDFYSLLQYIAPDTTFRTRRMHRRSTATNALDGFGIVVDCPANVIDNTVVNNSARNLVLNGQGCNNTNNVAP